MTPTANPILTVVVTMLFGVSGPFASWLLSKGVPKDQIGPFMEALQTMLSTVTPVLAASFLAWLNTVKQRLAGIKAMPPEAVTAAVASMPEESRTAIKVAAMPDEAILAAANKMPDVVAVVTKTGATDGVAAATADPTLPKVMSETSAPKS